MFRGLFQKVTQLFQGRTKIDDDLFDELEETLIESDVGAQTAIRLVQKLREATRKNRFSTAEEVTNWLEGEIERILAEGQTEIRWSSEAPTLILVVGVNGTGKTTSVAKLAQYFVQQRKKVLLAAADTFRAAAIDQLEIWADRVGVDLVRHREGADPAAVVFDAVQAARARGADVVLADTAGRLHTKTNLMEELGKVQRVSERALGRAPDEVLLVLDATIGQNAVQQAQAFAQVMPVSGIILTKMDGTARGGVIITVKDEMKIPIKFVGTGEKATDFDVFRPREFAAALFADSDLAATVPLLTASPSEPVPEAEAVPGPVPEPAPRPLFTLPWAQRAPEPAPEVDTSTEPELVPEPEPLDVSTPAVRTQPIPEPYVPPTRDPEPRPVTAYEPERETAPQPDPEMEPEAEPEPEAEQEKKPIWKRWFGR